MKFKYIFILTIFFLNTRTWAEKEHSINWMVIAEHSYNKLMQEFPQEISAINDTAPERNDTRDLLTPKNSEQESRLKELLTDLRIAQSLMKCEISTTTEPLPKKCADFTQSLNKDISILLASVSKKVEEEVNRKAAAYLLEHIHDERASVYNLAQCSQEERFRILESARQKLSAALSQK